LSSILCFSFQENDDAPNVSTPSSNRRSSDEEHGYDYDDTYDDEEFKAEMEEPLSLTSARIGRTAYECNDIIDSPLSNPIYDLAPVSPRAEPMENKHPTNTGEYCEFCSDYGHDTFSCESYLARRQGQRQTRHK
ncbi:hypothetical protein TELCIR_12843, partial [Teladorsagia circumcincta]